MVRKVISRSRETRAISRSARIRQKALLSFCLDRPLAAAVLCYICKRENGTHKSSQKTNFWPFYLMRRFNGGLFFFSLFLWTTKTRPELYRNLIIGSNFLLMNSFFENFFFGFESLQMLLAVGLIGEDDDLHEKF